MKKNYKIYMHINKVNQKVYIGQTYTSLKSRFGKNGIGYRRCTKFYKAIKKYGWNNFDHIVLADNISNADAANELEKYYISLYKSTDSKYGYNIQAGGHDQTLLSIPVYQYTLNGDFIKGYESIAMAQRENNINDKIGECCRGKRKSCGGFRWSFIKLDKLDKYERNSRSAAVYQYSLSGEFIQEYASVVDAVKMLNLKSGSHICSCCTGKRKNAHGYIWSYEKHENLNAVETHHMQGCAVLQYTRDGNLVAEHKNSIDACKQFLEKEKQAYFSINNCLNNRSKSAYGYIWVYKDTTPILHQDQYIQYSGLMKKVNQYDKENNYIKTFRCLSDAAREVSGATGNIAKCCKGEYKTAYGYIWRYAS